MDFTPGGFVNRTVQDFKITFPTQVMGTRARQLAMSVIYLSPLLVLCDSPENYRGQAGVEFFRGLPTVWDDTLVLNAAVGQSVALARRCGQRWYIAAMNGDDAVELRVPLNFLGEGRWTLRGFGDKPDAEPTEIVESTEGVGAETRLRLSLSPAGGYAGVIDQAK
jgi:alpha-glucosidase